MATHSPPGTVPERNRLLAALPRADYARIAARLQPVSLAVRDTLYRANGRIDYIYFPQTAVISMILIMEDGATVEVGTVGNEGMAGVPAFLGADRSSTEVFCQIEGEALRMDVATFNDEIRPDGALFTPVRRYSQVLLNQVSQTAACNRLHRVERRCARWLLMTHDRVGGADQFQLTQEFLAYMLGVRRVSVTEAAGLLQTAGLIEYRRGWVTIVNRAGLEAAACECYRIVREEQDRLVGPPVGAPR